VSQFCHGSIIAPDPRGCRKALQPPTETLPVTSAVLIEPACPRAVRDIGD